MCHTLELYTSATHQDRWVCTQKYNTEDLKRTSQFRDLREEGLVWHVGGRPASWLCEQVLGTDPFLLWDGKRASEQGPP